MTDDTHVLDLLPAFALGSLDPEETERVEQHLLSCLICRDESDAFQTVSEELSLVIPSATPPDVLRDRLMQRVHRALPKQRVLAQLPQGSWLQRLLPMWGLASLCLVVALAGLNLVLWQRLDQVGPFMSSGGMRAVPLSPPGADSKATGFVLISANGDEGALVVDGLPALDENQQYQVWLIKDGRRTSGAIFSTDEQSYGGTRIRAPGSLLQYSAVGITVEPAGGSPQPTGEQVLAGPLFNP